LLSLDVKESCGEIVFNLDPSIEISSLSLSQLNLADLNDKQAEYVYKAPAEGANP
jgi:hypothetical protein